MASVALDLFLPEVRPESPGAPAPVALNAIRNACYDFCTKSLLWNEVQDPYAYSAGVAEYQIDAIPDSQVVSVLLVTINDAFALTPTVLEDLARKRPSWASAQGAIQGFVQPQPDTIRFYAVPSDSGAFTPHVAYAPTRAAATIDARVYNQHLETIKHGALWKLKQMLGKDWSDPGGAAYHEAHFRAGVGAAIVERNRGNSRASLSVEMRPFV